MPWTTFAALTNPAMSLIDGNFSILNNLVPIPCTVSGTNSLALTSIAGGASIGAYSNYMQFSFIAGATNTAAVTAALTGIGGALNVYKDSNSGPVALTGGEIIASTACI